MDSEFFEDLGNIGEGAVQVKVETWSLSQQLFGNETWVLRLCYLVEAPQSLLETDLGALNVVTLNAKAIAGRRHIFAAVNAMAREFQAKRASEIAKDETGAINKSREVKNRISVHLPQALFVKTKHSSGVSHEALFAPVAGQGVFLVSISELPEDTSDPISTLIEERNLVTAPVSSNEPDVELLRRAYDLGETEALLENVEKAVCSRVAAKDCL